MFVFGFLNILFMWFVDCDYPIRKCDYGARGISGRSRCQVSANVSDASASDDYGFCFLIVLSFDDNSFLMKLSICLL